MNSGVFCCANSVKITLFEAPNNKQQVGRVHGFAVADPTGGEGSGRTAEV